MNGPEYELYRYENPNGTAKEWAYADLGNGLAEIRWGPEKHLRQRQEKPLRVAVERAREKERKGYLWIGRFVIDSASVPHAVSPRGQTSSVRQPPPKKPKQPAIDIAALLGGDEDGCYF